MEKEIWRICHRSKTKRIWGGNEASLQSGKGTSRPGREGGVDKDTRREKTRRQGDKVYNENETEGIEDS